MSTGMIASTFEVRGLCKVIGILGDASRWDEDTEHVVHSFLFQIRQEDLIRLADLTGHAELLHTERATGKVDGIKLVEHCIAEYSPLQLMRYCVQVLQERIGRPGDEEVIQPSAYAKHIDERDAQLARMIGRLEKRVEKLERAEIHS